MTLADVIARVEDQTRGKVRSDDFKPLPCSEPNCCSFTFLHRDRDRITPLTRFREYDQYVDRIADRIAFTPEDAAGCCGVELPAVELFRVVVKPFMDRFTYDQARIDECCVHIIDRAGEPVSLCEYNTLRRPAGRL